MPIRFFIIVVLFGWAGLIVHLAGRVSPASSSEARLGVLLERPVMQCGTGTDAVTADGMPGSVTLFESGPVRPIALSADGARLYVVNRPAHCLEIYSVAGDGLRLLSTVAVGMEPVAVAERNAEEVWVVNHLSDSVSVVRLDGTPRVLRTLQVGDEPRDIVFAGLNRERAFITAAWRGQNRPGMDSATMLEPGRGRADVWVYDATRLDDSLNGGPLTILTLFTDVPRALAVSPDGGTVYAASFHSGNRTTVLHRDTVLTRKPGPFSSQDGSLAPPTGHIVRFDGSAWRDDAGNDFSSSVRFSLPDYDLFAIDAMAATPVVKQQWSGIGTTLFNIATDPVSGKLFVSNTEARNHVRFEGPGTRASTLRGHAVENRITVLEPASNRTDPVHLNPHIDFSLPQGQELVASEKAKSLALPTAMVVSPDGSRLYLAALGSNVVAVLPTADLATGRFTPDATRHIEVPAGPAGLALSADGTRLFVYSHVEHRISIIDTQARRLLEQQIMFTPEAHEIRKGRAFLYDARYTSGNGNMACASCHTFGDMDHLAWDLGNPDERPHPNPNAYVPNSPRTTFSFHPMKGPMSTQTLRGMAGNGPLHWRGDRPGQNRQIVRGRLESLEAAAFKQFNAAFVSLNGRARPLPEAEMQAFTDFAMALAMPPNPVRALDGSLTPDEQAGRDLYFNKKDMTLLGSCNHCHTLDPANKRFGTSGLMTFEGFRITGDFKVPQLRNLYQKLGMFGSSLEGSAMGPQIRGFGFAHDGAIDRLENFFADPVFNFPAPVASTRRQMAQFMLVFDTELAPIVGQQVTWRPAAPAAVDDRLDLLIHRSAGNPAACDLIVRSTVNGRVLSGLREADGSWLMRSGARLDLSALKALATASEPLTFTCLPPGEGKRVALNGGPAPADAVIEYYHAGLDQYFITADQADIALLDGTPAAGLTRTGEWFRAGGTTPVCRFYGSVSPGPNTHFYTVIASECELLRQLAASTPATQPKLNFEKFDFHATPPNVDGTCPAGTIPVYRAYNEGHLRGRDGNHRLTRNLSAIAAVVARGWTNEGVRMCAPP